MSSYRQLGFVFVLSCLLIGGLIRAQAQSFTTLHTFSTTSSSGTNADGAYPRAGLMQASDGNLYGTAEDGGANGRGTIFKITPSGTFVTLHTFTAEIAVGADGEYPWAGLMQASDGNLYGTAQGGGANGTGTIFKITTSGAFTTLHSFSATSSTGTNIDGANPSAALMQASDGNLYGTATIGGINGTGTIFKITPSGIFTTLHNFSATSNGQANGPNTDGDSPEAALIQASDGNLYGTCIDGGANGNGTIFKITPSGAFTLLYTFSTVDINNANTDGFRPYGALVQASDGNLYGTAGGGGANDSGTLFKITLSGAFTTLYSLSAVSNGTNTDGISPMGLIQASDGNLYGTAQNGGANGRGTIFAYDLGSSTAPTLSSLSPGSVNAGGPAFTLTVKGTDFSSTDSVHWTQGTNPNALTTIFVSATQLKASVPASLIANPGKVSVTVVTSSGVASNSKTFTIKVTALKLTSATISKTSTGTYTASITLKNIGYLGASNVAITKASLGLANTSTSLPVSLSTLAAGASTSTVLSFPGSAGISGTVVYLKVSGTFTGGNFSGSLKVTLP